MVRTGQIERLTSIVAIDQDGAIGCRNSLPWRLKSDMAFFRETTSGNTVIMGRKTYDSIGGCLPNRKNIVLSHNGVLFPSTPNCQLALSLGEALARAGQSRNREVFVIGGAVTYAQFTNFVDRYLVTIVDHKAPDADAFLSPEILDQLEGWSSTELASHPASLGRDQFGFKVFELQAPNVAERQEIRASIVDKYLDKNKKSQNPRPKAPRESNNFSQDTFAF